MKLLLINTCGAEGMVALADRDQIVAVEHLPIRATSEHLMPAISRVLISPGSPEAVAVVTGPGSFTGIRAGLAAAKGLCEAWAVPMLALSRLALLATALKSDSEVVALLDAGRGEYYCGVYCGSIRLSEELLRRDEVESLLAILPGVTCDERVAAALTNVTLVPEPHPEAILAMALDSIAANQWSDVALTDANYLRRTDAELLQKQAHATSEKEMGPA
jgi:tRNA threonylcarbamoyladenosine biosynthesis protein TsaB